MICAMYVLDCVWGSTTYMTFSGSDRPSFSFDATVGAKFRPWPVVLHDKCSGELECCGQNQLCASYILMLLEDATALKRTDATLVSIWATLSSPRFTSLAYRLILLCGA